MLKLQQPRDVVGKQAHTPPIRRMKTHDRREQILKVASDLFLERGPSNVSTRMIADAVGVSQPSLYAHFATKDALADALAERAFQALERRIVKSKELVCEYGSHLEAMIHTYISFALEETAAYRIAFMLESYGPDAPLKAPGLVPGVAAFRLFAEEIRMLQARGDLKGNDPILLAQSVWAAMHGLCALLLARPHFPWADQETLIKAHVDLICHGVVPVA
jgi:AcrR family transcriptional regulator